MTAVSRRSLLMVAVAAPLIVGNAAGRKPRTSNALLVFDPQLRAGRRFADHSISLGGIPVAIEGDRIRQARSLLEAKPQVIFGVTQHADELLFGDVAMEAGYERTMLIQHRRDGRVLSLCAVDKAKGEALSAIAGSNWPKAFAELGVGLAITSCSAAPALPNDPAISWAFAIRR